MGVVNFFSSWFKDCGVLLAARDDLDDDYNFASGQRRGVVDVQYNGRPLGPSRNGSQMTDTSGECGGSLKSPPMSYAPSQRSLHSMQ